MKHHWIYGLCSSGVNWIPDCTKAGPHADMLWIGFNIVSILVPSFYTDDRTISNPDSFHSRFRSLAVTEEPDKQGRNSYISVGNACRLADWFVVLVWSGRSILLILRDDPVYHLQFLSNRTTKCEFSNFTDDSSISLKHIYIWGYCWVLWVGYGSRDDECAQAFRNCRSSNE
jgi:hypothetical protein